MIAAPLAPAPRPPHSAALTIVAIGLYVAAILVSTGLAWWARRRGPAEGPRPSRSPFFDEP